MTDEQSTEQTAEAPAEPTSLLDAGADVATDAPEPAAEPTPDNEVVLPDKFKSVDALVKSYTELEKKIGNFQGAPEEYELNVPDGIVLDEAASINEDPRVSALASVAKELNMGQEGFDKLLATALQAESEYQAAVQNRDQADQARELQKLGPNAKERMAMVGNFLANSLSEEQFEYARHNVAQTAEGAMFLEAVMQLAKGSTKIPTNITGSQPVSAEQMLKEADMARYMNDPAYRAAMQAKAGMR